MNKKLIVVIALITVFLIAVTGVAGVLFFESRPAATEGSVILSVKGKEETLSLSDLNTSPVSVDMVNGKGETKHIEGSGVRLLEIPEIAGASGYEEVILTSDDSYAATVGAEELGNAILLIEEGTARLIVENDKNAKRDVKNVVRIEAK